MSEPKSLYQKILQGTIYVFSLFLLLYIAVFTVREMTKIVTWKTSGNEDSEVQMMADSTMAFALVHASDFDAPPIPAGGDTIVGIADSVATPELFNAYFSAPRPVNSHVSVKYLSKGDTLETKLTFRLPTGEKYINILALFIIRITLVLSFAGVGLWAFLKRPDSAGIRALAFFCYAMSSFFMVAVSILSKEFASFQIPYQSFFLTFFSALLVGIGPFWLNLQLLFPRPKKFIIQHPVRAYLVCYAPTVICYILQIILPGFIISTAMFVSMSLQITIGMYLLAHTHRKALDYLERRQTGLVLWGSGIGLGVLFILLITIGVLFKDWFASFKWNILLINIAFLFLLLSPLSFVYAFGKYRLLEVQGKLRRGTRYLLVTLGMLGVLVGVVYLIGQLLVNQFGITDRTPMFIVSMGLALGFTPAWRRVQNSVERSIYPERQKLRLVMKDFLQKVMAIPDRATLWNQIEEKLRHSLHIESVYPVLKSKDGKEFYLCRSEITEIVPLQQDGSLIHLLQEANKPMLLDEAIAGQKVTLSSAESEWLTERRVAILLPMLAQGQLIGFLALGFKLERQDYSLDDLQLLSSLAEQAAMASENIRLLEGNIVKQRMEEELNLAQRIQKRFLPEQIPETPGLDVAARSEFCLEVAGDYYDVIALPNGQTVLAVGDVSGKGAGAALLMANLQASLRTTVGIGAGLSDLVARINDLIYHNTPPEQYITFFVAVFDASTHRLIYINAGHNQPLLLHPDGTSATLDQGGIPLGFFLNMPYQQGELTLQSGDVILMYTDGISEAMNPAEEEYGEERMLDYLQRHPSLSCAELLSGLEADVQAFTHNAPWADDVTMLAVRVG